MLLRVHNSHHNHIEILTFDQLLRIGKRTLEVFVDEYEKNNEFIEFVDENSDDEIPF